MKSKSNLLTKDQVLFLGRELEEVQKGIKEEVSYEHSFELVSMATKLQKEWNEYLQGQSLSLEGEEEEFFKIGNKLAPFQKSVYEYEPLNLIQYVIVINITLKLATNLMGKRLEDVVDEELVLQQNNVPFESNEVLENREG